MHCAGAVVSTTMRIKPKCEPCYTLPSQKRSAAERHRHSSERCQKETSQTLHATLLALSSKTNLLPLAHGWASACLYLSHLLTPSSRLLNPVPQLVALAMVALPHRLNYSPRKSSDPLCPRNLQLHIILDIVKPSWNSLFTLQCLSRTQGHGARTRHSRDSGNSARRSTHAGQCGPRLAQVRMRLNMPAAPLSLQGSHMARRQESSKESKC
jgi:hypothetical protein